MKKLLHTFFVSYLFFIPYLACAQNTAAKTRRLGAMYSYDLAYIFPDKLIQAGLSRKGLIGMTFTNKKRAFISYIAGGIKGAKINFYSPQLQDAFLKEVQQNYVTVNNNRTDSLIAASMYNLTNKVDEYEFTGTYAQYLAAGFIYNKSIFRPSISFYTGREQFLLFSKLLRGSKPGNSDYRYGTMVSTFKELKFGLAIPIPKFKDEAFAVHLNVGYKWIDYGAIRFEDTPLSAYTSGQIADRYRKTGKCTISLSFIIWSNWNNGN
jgi:hypothetical protein